MFKEYIGSLKGASQPEGDDLLEAVALRVTRSSIVVAIMIGWLVVWSISNIVPFILGIVITPTDSYFSEVLKPPNRFVILNDNITPVQFNHNHDSLLIYEHRRNITNKSLHLDLGHEDLVLAGHLLCCSFLRPGERICWVDVDMMLTLLGKRWFRSKSVTLKIQAWLICGLGRNMSPKKESHTHP